MFLKILKQTKKQTVENFFEKRKTAIKKYKNRKYHKNMKKYIKKYIKKCLKILKIVKKYRTNKKTIEN